MFRCTFCSASSGMYLVLLSCQFLQHIIMVSLCNHVFFIYLGNDNEISSSCLLVLR